MRRIYPGTTPAWKRRIAAMPVAGSTALITASGAGTTDLRGNAAAMDIGGRKMAAFASGVIDAFQYFGAALAMRGLGWVLDHKGWSWYFGYMIPFGILGGILMYSISHRTSLKKGGT